MDKILRHLYKLVLPKNGTSPSVLRGVYFDEGKLIASDGRTLIIVKQEYPREYEGKIIDKKGDEIEGYYPLYKRVIPAPLKRNLLPGVDKLFEAAKHIKKCGLDFSTLVVDKDGGISVEVLNKLLPFFKNDPPLFYYHKSNPPVFHLVGDNSEVVIAASELRPHTYITSELALQLLPSNKKK